jgi:hypothetical protein
MIARIPAVLLLSVSSAAAQEQPTKHEASNAVGQQASMLPKPSAEMERMARLFVGIWTVTEKHEPSPWSPNGASGNGTANLSLGPGGLSLVQDYHSSNSMGRFDGLGISWWDEKAQGFRGLWCENTAPAGCADSGLLKWEGAELVTEYEGDSAGQPTRIRRVISDVTPDSFTARMDLSIGGQPMKRAITITYKRSGPAKTP